MTNKWCTVILGDCIKINDAAYSPKEAWPFINYLDTGNITGNCISEIQHLVVGKDKIPSRARRKVQQGDIVYSTVRPNQRHFGLIKKLPNNFLASTGFAVISGKEDLALTDFIYWFLAQDHIVDYLQTLAEQNTSAYPSIKPSDIERLELKLPPLPEQRAIAHILGTLDDKIELNRRMNETLEEMARAIFKSWFVDFDPVRAKMDGSWRRGESLPGMPAEMYDLFPSRLVDSELGEIPEGWGVKSLGEIVESLRYNENPFSSPKTVFNHFSIPAYDKGQMPKQELGASIKSTKLLVKPGVVLLSKLNPEIERVWLVDISSAERPVCSTEFLVLQPKQPFQRSYIYCLTCSAPFRQQFESLVTGTSQSHQRAPTRDILKLKEVSPTESVIQAFEKQTSGILNRGLASRRESQTLAVLRDTLLPKLISGKLRVPDAELIF